MKTYSMNKTIALIILVTVFVVTPVQAGTLVDFAVNGSGTMETNCLATLTSGCTVTSSGQAGSAQLDVGSFFLRFDTGSPASLNGYPAGSQTNVPQGLCLPASFIGSLTSAAGDTLQFAHAGTVCEEAAPGSAFGYHGTFRITGGTGVYSTSQGAGSLTATFTRDGTTVFVHLHGAIQY